MQGILLTPALFGRESILVLKDQGCWLKFAWSLPHVYTNLAMLRLLRLGGLVFTNDTTTHISKGVFV